MCEGCVQVAEKEFASWQEEQRRIARLAITRQTHDHSSARADHARYNRGRETQRDIDAEKYQLAVVPKLLAVRAAVTQAEELLAEGKDPAEVLQLLLTNVRTDAAAIPLVLPK